MFCLTFMCLAPSGKEKIVKLYIPLPMMQSLISDMQKAIRRYKNRVSKDEEVKYIG